MRLRTKRFFRFFANSVFLCTPFYLIAADPNQVGSDFVSASGETKPPQLEDWASYSPPGNQSWFNTPDIRAADIIFDAISDVSLFTERLGKYSVTPSVHRHVFDNHDVLNSWTVVDRFSIAGSYPIFSWTYGPFSVGVEAGHAFDFVDIRQVLPANYSKMPSEKERTAQIKDSDWYKDVKTKGAQEEKIDKNNLIIQTNDRGEKELKTWQKSPENNARYSRMLNRLTHMFHIPLSVKAFSKMEDGEIRSYSVGGTGAFGPGVGWNIDPLGISGQLGINAQIYANVDTRISVLREDARFARVKTTIEGDSGYGANIGMVENITNLDGFIIVKDIIHEFKIIPFQLTMNREILGLAFDNGYRYDLQNPEAAKAYQSAVLKNFVDSDRLCFDEHRNRRDPKITGVEYIFHRESVFEGAKDTFQKFKVTFAYSRNQSLNLKQVDATITLPDGTVHVFSSLVENSREWKTVWGSFEKSRYDFSATLNLTKYEKDPHSFDAFVMSVDANLEESSTSYSRLISHITETENAVGQAGLFSRPPPELIFRDVKRASSGELEDISQRNTGRSRFYYRLNFNNPQLQKFIDTPESEQWPMIEKVFGAEPGSWSNPVGRRLKEGLGGALLGLTFPLYMFGSPLRQGTEVYHAAVIKSRWENIKQQDTIVKKLAALGNIFFDRYYSYELIRLLRLSLDGEEVDYLVTASNPVIGNLYKHGKTQLQFENIGTKLQQTLDFDRQDAHLPDLTKETEISDASAVLIPGNKIKISFSLNAIPKAIFLQGTVWGTVRFNQKMANPLGNVLFFNDGSIKAGENFLILDPSDEKSSFYNLAKQIIANRKYDFRLAANADGVTWGRTVDVSVTTSHD
ncbi:MAG: hypothetical protein JWQ35_158 [Bacteriovoracaceae bacterium]|nr:hypothetical protein [Bacteriovoracaceae bacterium]